MKFRVMITAWAVLELAAQAKDKEELGQRCSRMDVYVHFRYCDAALVLGRAEGIASEMLYQTGVQIRWRSGSPKNDHGFEPILIDFTSDTPQSLLPGAMGSARGYDAHIRIFWDRVNATGDSGLIAPLLAHVLVHEITHILQGCSHHSQTGVMKARWTLHDVVAMATKPLPFEPVDVELIHSGLALRSVHWRPNGASSQRFTIFSENSAIGRGAVLPSAASAVPYLRNFAKP